MLNTKGRLAQRLIIKAYNLKIYSDVGQIVMPVILTSHFNTEAKGDFCS